MSKDDFSLAPTVEHVQTIQSFQLPPLYKISAGNKVAVWIISFDGTSLISTWGLVDAVNQGRGRTNSSIVKTNKSGRDLHDQALLEARSKWKRKVDKDGYSEKLESMTILTMTAMLANTWSPEKNQIRRWPVWVEEKIDGIRCRAHSDEKGEVMLMSRTALVFQHLNHIRVDLLNLFAYMLNVLQTNYPNIDHTFRLDGELYSTELTFDTLNGITRLVDSVSPYEKFIDYYLFDLVLVPKLTYDERFTILLYAYNMYQEAFPNSHIKLIIPRIASNKQDIITQLTEYVKNGFEGIIIRKVNGQTEKEREDSYYLGRRSSNILKYKLFEDEEGIIIGADEGSGSEIGAVIWKVRAPNDREFSVRPRGSIDVRREYYKVWQQYVGKQFRYRFQDKTTDGYPRFPVGLGFVFDR